MRFDVWTRRQLLWRIALLLALDTLLSWSCALVIGGVWRQADVLPIARAAEAVPVMAAAEEVPMAVPEGSPAPEADKTFRIEVIRPSDALQGQGKRILIYHTHTWEAFQQVKGAPYQETEKWRTKDNAANMVAVGDALTAALTAMGYEVVHDITAFEPPNLSSSYQRSLNMLEERCGNGEHFDLYIDLHRDAYSSSSSVKRTVSCGGQELARLMVLVGKGEGYDAQPDWEANLAVAQSITDSLNRQVDDLCRDVKVKTGRFNQHIAPCCVLIECGSNYNTLQEVLCSMPYLARAIHETLTPKP